MGMVRGGHSVGVCFSARPLPAAPQISTWAQARDSAPWAFKLSASLGWVKRALAGRHDAALCLPLPPQVLRGQAVCAWRFPPGALAKDTRAPGKMAVGLGADRARRPQVSGPTAAKFTLQEAET